MYIHMKLNLHFLVTLSIGPTYETTDLKFCDLVRTIFPVGLLVRSTHQTVTSRRDTYVTYKNRLLTSCIGGSVSRETLNRDDFFFLQNNYIVSENSTLVFNFTSGKKKENPTHRRNRYDLL